MYYVNIKGDIYMKAFKGSFKKKSGENREMFLPEFLTYQVNL